MEERTARFLKNLFSCYYREKRPVFPLDLPHREFAFMLFGQKAVIRHRGFSSHEELWSFMAELGPSDAFYSSAHFERPDAPDMKSKGWLGADLIFDIDADHLPTSCKEEHDLWACPACGREGRGEAPDKCPGCGSKGLVEVKWICDKCISAAKDEVIKLAEVLEAELGIQASDMVISFSGHRGFHLQVISEDLLPLGQDERREIVDYLLGLGLEPELLGVKAGARLSINDVGWRGRIARGLYRLLLRAREEDLRALGLRSKAARALLSSRDVILNCLEQGKPLYLPKGLGRAQLRKLVAACVEDSSVKVDPVVTGDTHRLVRMSGTLHGKTGLLKVDIPLLEVEDFDPFGEAIAFRKGKAKVKVKEEIPQVPPLRLGDQEFGPFEAGQLLELPLQVAVFLMCKKVAELA